jgi:DNA-binding transcriptional MerR regulator
MAYTIKELETLSGVKAHTIRIWEQRYQFLKPSRTGTNIRTYNNEELKTLLTVALLNKYGYKISRISEMAPEQRVDAIMQLPQKEAVNEGLVNELIGFMVDLDSASFEDALDKYIAQHGMERLMMEVIFLFLEKVGILWQTNKIIPVQEHIVSNLIRQKVVSALDVLPFVTVKKPLFLLFLPEDEHHELGLLYMYYLLRKSGKPVIYLGANVPVKDLGYLMQVKKPDYLYVHLTSFPRPQRFQKFMDTLMTMAPQAKLLVSGSVTQEFKKPENDHIFFLKSLGEVLSWIERAE